MTEFSDLGLAEPILRAVRHEGYTHPTPIQTEAIPAMLEGRDLVGIAQTGTGKTASFVLPLLHAIAQRGARPEPKTCSTLILVPTRELAAQVAESARAYGRFMRPRVALVIGGVKPAPQIRAMAPGVDILIATPGRLEDHMSTGAIRLDRTRAVVLDEADQMLDLGFVPAIRRILGKIPAKRQTVLFSATMPKPIRALAADFLHDPTEVAVTPAARPIEKIDQSVIHTAKADKRARLVDILRPASVDRAIVFTRTKHGADRVCRHLDNAGLPAVAIHGNKSQGQRERALAAFKSTDVRILVATDIAARGIDIDDVSHVVNFELPNVPEVYVHRIGRTARAGKAGVAVSLCDAEERKLLRDIERLIGRSLPLGEASEPEQAPARRASSSAPKGRQERNGNAPRRAPRKPGPKPGSRPSSKRRRERRPGNDSERGGLERMLANVA